MRPLRVFTAIVLIMVGGAARAAPDAQALVRKAFDNWRGGSSQSSLTMRIHRPSWERSMSMQAWTEGDDKALVRFTAPAKDAGNATLTVSGRTWVYDPKLSQTIALPASMMAQSWMGSDFSNDDLSKSEALLTDYTHRIVGETREDGRTVYSIEAIPKPGAPVVWGKQVVKVRDDGVFLAETFYDQRMRPVRAMTTDKVAQIGGRPYPAEITMRPAGKPGEWTTVTTLRARFGLKLPAYTFTLSNLANPRS
ncbi:MAG TPA: outer membrane lipoprotein-sorting protein [Caulobacteraceae bacterium]|nr:outer membrane lipoprotein-sorting protein [Caulobacteraceae bacterium]